MPNAYFVTPTSDAINVAGKADFAGMKEDS